MAMRAKESSPGTSGFPVSAKTLVGYIIMQGTRIGQWLRDTDAQPLSRMFLATRVLFGLVLMELKNRVRSHTSQLGAGRSPFI